MLAETASRSDHQRGPQAMAQWVEYKNGPNPRPVTLDFSGGCLFRACPLLERSHPASFDTGQRTHYERLILQLKQGDTVVFDGQAFKLGRFLGAGNATHVFELEGEGAVIRLPFLADGMFRFSAMNEFDVQKIRYSQGLEFTKHTAKALKGSGGAVKVLKEDPHGRFLVTEKVSGTQTGAGFLGSLLKDPSRALGAGEVLIFPNGHRTKPVDELSPLEREKLEKLIELMKENRHVKVFSRDEGLERSAVFVAASRQYLWDEVLRQWRVIDAE